MKQDFAQNNSNLTEIDKKRAFISWSGGKDSCLAYYWALYNGYQVESLLSMLNKEEDGNWLWPHRLSPSILRTQAEALGVESLQKNIRVVDYCDYDKAFLSALEELRDRGITHGIFGDNGIGEKNALQHRQWVTEMCSSLGITPIFPLWDLERGRIIQDFINLGFKAVIITADNDNLGYGWLGAKLDDNMLTELKRRASTNEEGNVGYYHTFVVDGPVFHRELDIQESEHIYVGNTWGSNWYLDIKACHLLNKTSHHSDAGFELQQFGANK